MRGISRLSAGLFGFVFLITVSSAASKPEAAKLAQLKHSYEFILKQVADYMAIALRADVTTPKVFLESQTPLKQFQDAIEPQWRIRPHVYLNAFVINRNEIYLIDEAKYYKRMNSTVDDSLAHELVHFFQAKYRNWDLSDPVAESQAVTVQTWFRETYMGLHLPDQSPAK